MTHNQVLVEVGNVSKMIDEMIAPLIREIWLAFIMTSSSCQDFFDDGRAWIAFPNEHEMLKFLNIVGGNGAAEDGKHLYARMSPETDEDIDGLPSWQYHMRLFDSYGPEYGGSEFTMSMMIWFPQEDIPELAKRLKRHNKSPLEDT